MYVNTYSASALYYIFWKPRKQSMQDFAFIQKMKICEMNSNICYCIVTQKNNNIMIIESVVIAKGFGRRWILHC